MNLFSKQSLNRWRFTIRKKIIIVFSLMISIISFFILLFFPSQQEQKSITAITDKAQSMASLLAFNISPALFFNDLDNINEVFKSARQNRDIVYLVVTDISGNIITATNFRLAKQVNFLHTENKNNISNSRTVLKTKAVVANNKEKIGELYLGLSLQDLRIEISRSRTTIALVSLIILVLGILTVFSISTLITAPLKRMVGTVERISQGDLTQRATVTSHDEVGHLASSFNQMVQNLESAYAELENINQNLELRVTERTEELQQEINERIRVDEAIRHSEERFRILVENSYDALYVVQNHQFVFVNFKFEQLLGYSLAEISSADFILTDIVADKNFEPMPKNENLFANDTEKPTSFNFTGRAKTGKEIDFEVRVTPIIWEGKPAVLGSMRDVMERNQLQQQLQQATKMEAIGRLAGGVAHDFNNLLTAINGYVELLQEDLEPSSAIYNDIEEIGKAGKQATNLTRQLLAFSRQQVVNLQVINTNSVIQNMGNMLQRMIGEDIKLSIHLTEDLGSIKADTGQIEQILINLAVNARDAMLTGGLLTIETANVFLDEKYCQAHAGQQPGPYVMLAVSDNGIGMSDEVKEKIFEPFFTTKEKGKGTGLGLSTVYGIVKQSTGSIRVYSEPGQGTTFTIYLPRVNEAVETNTSPQEETGLLQGSETVLVVEDEDMVRELTVRILGRLGYNVIEAHNAEEALHIEQNYQDGVIHLLLTDVVMPNMNGIELSKKLQERHQDLKIIFMSGYTNNVIIDHGILNAKHQFIQKPFTASDLASKVRIALTEDQPVTISA